MNVVYIAQTTNTVLSAYLSSHKILDCFKRDIDRHATNIWVWIKRVEVNYFYFIRFHFYHIEKKMTTEHKHSVFKEKSTFIDWLIYIGFYSVSTSFQPFNGIIMVILKNNTTITRMTQRKDFFTDYLLYKSVMNYVHVM